MQYRKGSSFRGAGSRRLGGAAAAVAVLPFWLTLNCATAVDLEPGPDGGTNGATGGSGMTGGTGGSGGTPAVGGTSATGGVSGTGTGGVAAAPGGGTGGVPAGGSGGTGGATGGSSATGGTGATGGGSGAGGAAATGGVAGTGGMGGTGGAAPACDDLMRNGTETGVDCGGSCETKCPLGEGCSATADCAEGVCDGTVCSSCGDGELNGDETDLDCGGSCDKCEEDQMCSVNADCITAACDGDTGTCTAGSHCLLNLGDCVRCPVINESEREKCEEYLQCYIENDCGPDDACATGNGAPCHVNEIGGGTSPKAAADQTYECACE